MATTTRRNVRMEWFGKNVNSVISREMKSRVKVATKFLQANVRRNISVPVATSIGPRGGIIKERSKPGEFPRKDFGNLWKDIFGITQTTSRGVFDGFVGTTLSYGAILEVWPKINRAFLVPTLFQSQGVIKNILTAPIK